MILDDLVERCSFRTARLIGRSDRTLTEERKSGHHALFRSENEPVPQKCNRTAKYQKVEETVVRISRNNDFLLLLLAKYIYGTRILTIFYVSLKELAFGKFLVYSSISAVCWIIPICTIGWLAGKGFEMVLTIFKNVQLAVTFLVVLVVLFYVIQRVIKRWLIQKRSP